MKIRFRALNKHTKELRDVLSICFVNEYVSVLPDSQQEGQDSWRKWKFEDIILMQYIGKTRRGVDVYEDVSTLETAKDYRREVSGLSKKLNSIKKQCTQQMVANTNRKEQTASWNKFFEKPLSEGRISVEELRLFSPPKHKNNA